MYPLDELKKVWRHDINGTCKQLTSALSLLESLTEKNDPEAMEVHREMCESLIRLTSKFQQLPPNIKINQ